ncbi:cytochrome P450 [Nocardia sp. NPDC006630]|uniref:cytochrome P450 n=1 Tax=Nocardia sp. NPDC006630 TaxID=3157181 RepID=UPI00339FB37B
MKTQSSTKIPTLGRARLPVFGDIGGFAGQRTAFELPSAFGELGSLISANRFGRQVLLAGRVDVVSDLCDDSRFVKFVGPALKLLRGNIGGGLFTADNADPNWAKAHNILMPGFAMDEIDSYHPVMLRVADALMGKWDAAADRNPVDVVGDLTGLTLDTIGLAGFGYDFGSFGRATSHPFVEALREVLTSTQQRLRRPPGSDRLFRRQDAAQREQTSVMLSTIDDVLRARRERDDTSTDDLLGLMLNAVDPRSGAGLDDTNIRDQIVTFLVAGHETTSGALSFALYELVKNPVALARATAEVDALWGAADNPRPTADDVRGLRYVRQCLDESLRLWPTAPGFNRVSATDSMLAGRYPVPAGQQVLVVLPALHRDPCWGENVDAFDPDRFTPERTAARPVHAYKPFGTGERACIGSRFAVHEATLVLGLLLHRYAFDDHRNYRLEVAQTLTVKPRGFTLRLRRRTPAERAVAELPAAIAVESPKALRAKGAPLTVLHGSNLGVTARWADTLAARAAEAGFTVHRGSLDDAVDSLPADHPVLLLAASYNGRCTDDAARFVERLEHARDGEFDGVRFGVLGVGDRNWSATYQRVPTFIDERLAAGGAQRLVPRGIADAAVGLAVAADPWIEEVLGTLLREFGEPVEGPVGAIPSGHRIVKVTATDAATALTAGFSSFTVAANEPLTDQGRPGRTKTMLRLELPAGSEYRTSDQLVVLAPNPDRHVKGALAACALEGEQLVVVEPTRTAGESRIPAGMPITVEDLLRHTVDLRIPVSDAIVRRLAELNPCPPEARALADLAESAAELARPTLIELVERYPALTGRIDLATLLDLLPPLRPRTYSISSSPAASPRAVELLVAVVESEVGERGTGSGYLADLAPGDRIRARLQPCREVFRVDPASTVPTVLIAAGSGLAPFHGVIADRLHALRQGVELAQATLYFGCDHPDLDYLYRDVLAAAETAGVVRVRAAFSRQPVENARYAQDRLAQDADQIWAQLQAGARVYVCGDARRLAPGVREALMRIYRDNTGADAGRAQQWLGDLGQQGRYVEDVYAS